MNDLPHAHVLGIDSGAARDKADELDHAALATIGVRLDVPLPTGRAALGKLVPLTAGARRVIEQALANATAEKARTITSRHIMLALLDRPAPDPAATLLAARQVDPAAVRKRLRPTG